MNGVAAKRGFQYQDYCTMYFLLKEYCDNLDTFNDIIVENGKFDFELYSNNRITQYQVKSSPEITAEEINKHFQEFIKKSRNKKLVFIFPSPLQRSIAHLFLKLKGDRSVKKYNKQTEKYVNAACKGIDCRNLDISYEIHPLEAIKTFLDKLSRKILEDHLAQEADIYKRQVSTTLVDTFIEKFKIRIEECSTKNEEKERTINNKNLKIEIDKILNELGYPIKDSIQFNIQLNKTIRIEETLKMVDDFIKNTINKSASPEKNNHE